jgi:hypothetical protein
VLYFSKLDSLPGVAPTNIHSSGQSCRWRAVAYIGGRNAVRFPSRQRGSAFAPGLRWFAAASEGIGLLRPRIASQQLRGAVFPNREST